MLNQNTDETLNRAEAYAVNHNRAFLCAVCCCVFQLKAFGHLHIQLNCTALPCSADGVLQMEVNLRAVECTIAFIDGIFNAVFIQCVLQTCCCNFPSLVRAHAVFGSCGQFNVIFKAEQLIYTVNQADYAGNFILNLFFCHEDMCVILVEAANTHQAMQCAALFVSVYQTDFSHTHRQVPAYKPAYRRGSSWVLPHNPRRR